MMTTPAVYSISDAPTGIFSSALDSVPAVGAAWMLSSALFTTYSATKFLKYQPSAPDAKGKLSILPRASLLTLLRFGGSLALGILAHPNLRILDRVQETLSLFPAFALPALFLFVANYANSISLNRIGISLTYTSKCAIPLVTLVLTVLLDGTQVLPRLPVLLSLVPIGLGIAAASWNNPRFELIGFIAALASCTSQSALNVSTKRIMKNMNVAGPVAQRTMVAVGLIIASALSLFQIASRREHAEKNAEIVPPTWLSALAVTAYHVEYVLSFIFVTMVSPITYAASDAVRRLSIIISGHYMFGGPPFTKLNTMGIAMALVGALTYSVLNNM